VCGIVSSVLYVGTEIAASLAYPGYSYTSGMVSELGAIGAPTRPQWIAMSVLYNPLVIAFGAGVLMVAGEKRSLRAAGVLLVAYGLVSALGPLVPMQQRGNGLALTDVLHIACTVGMVASVVLFIAFGATASGKGFRAYSIVTLFAIVVGGVLAGVAGGQAAAGQATPMIGVFERVNIYSEMLWVLVLAVVLLRDRSLEASARARRRRLAGVLESPTAGSDRWQPVAQRPMGS